MYTTLMWIRITSQISVFTKHSRTDYNEMYQEFKVIINLNALINYCLC